MRVITFAFGDDYVTMARVLAASVRENWPAAECVVVTPPAPKRIRGHPRYTANWTEKWRLWREAVESETEPFVLMDADMLVLQPMDTAFNGTPYDVCATTHPGHCPISTGVIFVRPGPGASRLFGAVWDECQRLLANRRELAELNKAHGGIDQSAYFSISTHPGPWEVSLLPSDVYNLTNPGRYRPHETRAVHYWGRLKRLVLGKSRWRKSDGEVMGINPNWELVERWKGFKRKADEYESARTGNGRERQEDSAGGGARVGRDCVCPQSDGGGDRSAPCMACVA